jgi:hypothetical protein
MNRFHVLLSNSNLRRYNEADALGEECSDGNAIGPRWVH